MERDMLKKATAYFANLKSNPKDIGQAKPGFA